MHATRKVKLKDLSPNLTCPLCGGYFIDATTIIECVHSFCRACIVRHLERSEYCPVCEVQLHSSKPLSSIRSDKMLQEIVYKLVPGLFQNEMTNRRQYYSEHSEVKPRTQQDGGQVFTESYITSDDMIHLSLEFDTTDKKLRESTKRFILCPAAVSIAVLKKLIQGKYDLKNTTNIEIMYRERYLPDDFLLMDIAYKYSWSQNGNGPLQLYYRVHGIPKPPSPFKCKSLSRDLLPLKSTKKEQAVEADQKFTPPLLNNSKLSVKKSLTPSGRPRGRPKRKPSITSEDPVVEAKKVKLAKGDMVPSKKETKIKVDKGDKFVTDEKIKPKGTKREKKKKSLEWKESSAGTEVQLRISENGVIRAKSVTSGEEKIINPTPSPIKVSSSPPGFNGFSPIPIGFSRKPVTTNGNRSSPSKSPSPMDTSTVHEDFPISLTNKKRVENGDGIEVPKIDILPRKDHVMLKVPTPGKWIHHSINNHGGHLKIVTKASPAKDSLGFTTVGSNTPSPAKKPPKFFKSRISDSWNGTTGRNDQGKVDVKPEAKSTDLKVPGTSPPRSDPCENGVDLHEELRKKAESTVPAYPEHTPPPSSPNATAQQMTHHHQYPSFGLHVDDNMNMGGGGGGMGYSPMQFVPSLANGYCSFPFFPNPNPAIHPFLHMAMSMNLNPPYSYGHNSTPTPTTINNPPTKSQKKSKGKKSMVNSLDLSIPGKKSNKKSSSYVQISPKKSPPEEPKKCSRDKTEEVKGILLSSTIATSAAVGFRTPPKKERSGTSSKPGTPRKLATPKKILSTTDVPPGPRNDPCTRKMSPEKEQKTENVISSPTKDDAGDTNKNPGSPLLAAVALSNGGGSTERLSPTPAPVNTHEFHQPNFCDEEPMPTLRLVEYSNDSTPELDSPPANEISSKRNEAAVDPPIEPKSPSTKSTMLATATLTVTVDDPESGKSGTAPGTPRGKSPTTTLNNNNNIIRNSSDCDTNPPPPPESGGVSPCPSVSVNIISSSTPSTTKSSA